MQEHVFISLQLVQLRELIIDCISHCLNGHAYNENKATSDVWLDIKELCEYLPNKPKKQTIYGYISASKIPVHKSKGEKKLRFLKSEIDAWLMQGKRKHLQK